MFDLFSGLRRRYGLAVDSLGLWDERYHQCAPDITIEIAVDGGAEDYVEASFRIQRLRNSRRMSLVKAGLLSGRSLPRSMHGTSTSCESTDPPRNPSSTDASSSARDEV